MISPADRITLIRQSMRVFTLGLLSVLPVIGLIPAIYVVTSATRLGHRFRNEWNPAAVHVCWGVTLALLSIGITSLAVLIIVLQLVPPYGSS